MELNVQLDESRSQVRLSTFAWKTVSQICSSREQAWSTLLGLIDLLHTCWVSQQTGKSKDHDD